MTGAALLIEAKLTVDGAVGTVPEVAELRSMRVVVG